MNNQNNHTANRTIPAKDLDQSVLSHDTGSSSHYRAHTLMKEGDENLRKKEETKKKTFWNTVRSVRKYFFSDTMNASQTRMRSRTALASGWRNASRRASQRRQSRCSAATRLGVADSNFFLASLLNSAGSYRKREKQ